MDVAAVRAYLVDLQERIVAGLQARIVAALEAADGAGTPVMRSPRRGSSG